MTFMYIEDHQKEKTIIPSDEEVIGGETERKGYTSLLPNIQSLAFIYRTDEPNSVIQLGELRKTAADFIEIMEINVCDTQELEQVFSATDTEAFDALYLACDTLIQSTEGGVLVDRFLENGAIGITCNKGRVKEGALMGLVEDFYDTGRLSGEKAVLVLNDIPPSSLETNTVGRPLLYLNKAVAKKLSIPQDVLLDVSVLTE